MLADIATQRPPASSPKDSGCHVQIQVSAPARFRICTLPKTYSTIPVDARNTMQVRIISHRGLGDRVIPALDIDHKTKG